MARLRTGWRWTGCRRSGALATLLLAALGASGCGSVGYDSSLSAAQLRFVHVSPGSPELDFFVNGSGAAYGVGYANFTSYLPVLPGAASVSVRRSGMDVVTSSADLNLAGGRQYTAVISRGLGNLREQILPDQDVPAAPGTIAIRVLDEVEAVGGVRVYFSPVSAGAAAVPSAVRNLTVGNNTGYVTLSSATAYTVTLSVAERALQIPVGTVTVKAASGAVRTVVFTGVAQAGGKNVLGFVLSDADAS